jgi:hypothetical protein
MPGSTKSAFGEIALGHSCERGIERRHDRADDDAADFAGLETGESEEFAAEDAVFVDGLIARGGQAPVRDEFFAAEDAEHGVGVADIERQKHQEASATSPEITGSMPPPSSRITRRTPLGSRPAVVPVKASAAVVMRTRFP